MNEIYFCFTFDNCAHKARCHEWRVYTVPDGYNNAAWIGNTTKAHYTALWFLFLIFLFWNCGRRLVAWRFNWLHGDVVWHLSFIKMQSTNVPSSLFHSVLIMTKNTRLPSAWDEWFGRSLSVLSYLPVAMSFSSVERKLEFTGKINIYT